MDHRRERPLIEIRHPAALTSNQPSEQRHELLQNLIITITARLVTPAERSYFEKLFRDEQAMGRALALSSNEISTHNVLGTTPKLRLQDWTVPEAETFPLRRTEPWNPRPTPQAEARKQQPTFGMGEPPPELRDIERLKHPNRTVLSPIDISVWEKAGWKGIGFITPPDVPPILALLFEHKTAATNLFTSLKRDFGEEDEHGELSITIITGIDRTHPAHYRVLISPTLTTGTPGSDYVMVSKVLTVTPATAENLERFQQHFDRAGVFYFGRGHIPAGQTMPAIAEDLLIRSRACRVRPAWEVAENEPDAIGIQEDDDIMIPDSITDPPILRTLERIKKRRQSVPETRTREPSKSRTKVGRNQPCPCGSGKKFKKCHGT